VLPALCLISIGYVSTNLPLAVFLIITGVGFTGVSYVGWGVNSLDLAPQFAGQNNYCLSYLNTLSPLFEMK